MAAEAKLEAAITKVNSSTNALKTTLVAGLKAVTITQMPNQSMKASGTLQLSIG